MKLWGSNTDYKPQILSGMRIQVVTLWLCNRPGIRFDRSYGARVSWTASSSRAMAEWFGPPADYGRVTGCEWKVKNNILRIDELYMNYILL